MTLESIVVILIVGGLAGWLAGLIVRGGGMGLLTNIVVGVVGAFIASVLFPMVGMSIGGGWIAAVIYATFGAVILLVLLQLVKRG